jgi:biopolymer transport protein ExbB/TolQ
MTALIITALSIIIAAAAYRLLRVLGGWFDEIVLAANDVPERRDDALGEVGEGLGVKAFGAHYGEDK